MILDPECEFYPQLGIANVINQSHLSLAYLNLFSIVYDQFVLILTPRIVSQRMAQCISGKAPLE